MSASELQNFDNKMDLHLLSLEENEKENKKRIDLLAIEEETTSPVQSGKKKQLFDNINVTDTHLAGVDEIAINFQKESKLNNETPQKEDDFKKKNSPRKRTRKQVAEANIKLTEIFQVNSPANFQKESKIKEKKNKKTVSKEANRSVKEKESAEKENITPTKNKTKTAKNASNIKNKENEDDNFTPTTTYIDLEALNQKDKITNSEMILAIVEISMNSKKYGIRIKNKKREFWKQVFEKADFSKILEKFAPETMRKYWRLISNISGSNNDFTRIIEVLSKYSEYINHKNVKLLPVINTISAFIFSESESFEPFIKKLSSQLKSGNEEDMLNKKRERDGSASKTPSKTKHPEKDDTSSKKPTKAQASSTKKKNKENSEITEDEIDESEAKIMEEIVLSFMGSFQDKSEEEILDTLKITSFNIENAYLYLTDPVYFSELGYLGPDDKIVLRLQNSTAFKKLLKLKGQESIEERKRFLKNQK